MAGAILARRASILASAAVVSGGIGVDFAEDLVAIPSLVTWGGIEDFALEQDFHLLAESMITDLDAQGHFLVTCNHGLAHDFPVGGWEWVFDFLLSHELGVLDSPLSAGLPASYPEYCEIAS